MKQIGSESKNCRTDLPGPVWPVHRTGLTGHNCSRTCRPVWPVLPTGLTGRTQKTTENLYSNDESQPNDHENRWNLGNSFALPREHIPKRSRPKDNQILRIMGEIKRDWGFLKYSRTSILVSSWFQKDWHEARSTGITPKSSTNHRNQVHQNLNVNPSQKAQDWQN